MFILIVGTVVASIASVALINSSISLDKDKKATLTSIGITEPVISSCIKINDDYCKATIYEKGGIKKDIKIKYHYCETYVFEEVDDECIAYEEILGEECENQSVMEVVCNDVEKEECSWQPFESFWNYICETSIENVCENQSVQICNPYTVEHCSYEDVYINNESKEYKEKVCVDVEIANCTGVLEEICVDEVVGQTCIENSTKLIQTDECKTWKTLTQREIEEQMIIETEKLLNQIAEVQAKRNNLNDTLTDKINLEIK